ncbi:MMPL family transporter [Nonomuraea sp. NPDC002799]
MSRTASATGRDTSDRLARRRSRIVILLTAVCFAGALLIGHDVHDRLIMGDTAPIGASSARAGELLQQSFGGGNPHLVLIARAPRPVSGAPIATAGMSLVSRLRNDAAVDHVTSFWDTRAPSMRSRDGRTALILARLRGDHLQRITSARRLAAELSGPFPPFTIGVTGEAKVRAETQEQSEADLRTAELIAAPLTLLVLLLVFGGLVAALLPLLVGVLAVAGTMAVLRLLTEVTEISVFAMSIASALGFALAVDFSLFIVTRFREELGRGLDPRSAVAVTMRTTGRAMAYSAATVTLSLGALLLFPFTILRSIAWGGIAITILAAAASLLVLPAVLVLLGERVNRLSIPRLRRAAAMPGSWWFRLAIAVMRRPLGVAVPSMVLLLALGAPFLNARFATLDDRVLPPDAPAARAAQQLRQDFDGSAVAPTTIVLPHLSVTSGGRAAGTLLADYAQRLSAVPGVTRVDAATGAYRGGAVAGPPPGAEGGRFTGPDGSRLTVSSAYEPYSVDNSDLAKLLRRVSAPGRALLGGPGAELADTRRSIGQALPLALTLIALTTLLLVTALTRSIVLALKALIMNALSLAATFGALVYVFQEGHLRWLVGDFTVTGSIDVLMPSLIFCIAFGLSMDYEIFLLSRITEEYRRSGDTLIAVAAGLQHTGRLFTSAATVFAVVMAALATSGLTVLKMIGVGLALAVLLDCTVVRALLVPAVMRLAGRANWWSPFRVRDRPAPRDDRETSPAPAESR